MHNPTLIKLCIVGMWMLWVSLMSFENVKKYPLHAPCQQTDRLLFTQIILHFKSPREVLMVGSPNNRWRKPYPAVSETAGS